MLVGSVSDSWATEAASALNCKISYWPFLYLGLTIGGDFYNPFLSYNSLIS